MVVLVPAGRLTGVDPWSRPPSPDSATTTSQLKHPHIRSALWIAVLDTRYNAETDWNPVCAKAQCWSKSPRKKPSHLSEQESPEPRMEGEGFDTKSSISKGVHTGH